MGLQNLDSYCIGGSKIIHHVHPTVPHIQAINMIE